MIIGSLMFPEDLELLPVLCVLHGQPSLPVLHHSCFISWCLGSALMNTIIKVFWHQDTDFSIFKDHELFL